MYDLCRSAVCWLVHVSRLSGGTAMLNAGFCLDALGTRAAFWHTLGEICIYSMLAWGVLLEGSSSCGTMTAACAGVATKWGLFVGGVPSWTGAWWWSHR